MRRVRIACLVLLLLASAEVAAQRPPPLRYAIRTDASLAHMDVRVCFTGSPAVRMIPGVPRAAAALVSASDQRGQPLRVTDGVIDTSRLPLASCMRYRVDLDAAIRNGGYGGRFERDLVVTAGAWLWRPQRQSYAYGSVLRFELPPQIHAAMPWPRTDGVYHLDATAFTHASFTALGTFTPIEAEAAGARFTIVRVDDRGWSLDDAEIVRWLERTAGVVATVQGRFPVDRALIVFVPGAGEGVGFGMVRRGGGASVAFVVGKRTPDHTQLLESWVPWHELSHLLLPALPVRDAWFSEGLATYYQEVLRARAGIQPPRAAWRELTVGFERGSEARTVGTLADASETMMQTRSFMRVYWSGTAFFLEADMTMRERGSSLDQAIARGAARWRGDVSPWTSERICQLWDTPLEAEVLRPLRARYAQRTDFPDVWTLLARLGITRARGDVELRTAALSPIRDAIMSE
jgi:hypothetical protein